MKIGKYWDLDSNIWMVVHKVTEEELLIEVEGFGTHWFDRETVESDKGIVSYAYKELEALFSLEE
jgi:hypothetical protein